MGIHQKNEKINMININFRWTRIGESSADYPSPSHSNSSTFKPRLSMVQTADFPPNSPVYHSQERITLSNSNTGHIRSPLSLHQAQVHVPADPKSGRKESPQEKPAKPIARESADESAVSCDDVISAGGSSKESRTSADRGTSTSDNPGLIIFTLSIFRGKEFKKKQSNINIRHFTEYLVKIIIFQKMGKEKRFTPEVHEEILNKTRIGLRENYLLEGKVD